MSAFIITRVAEKVLERAVASRVAAGVTVNAAARVSAQRAATIAAESATKVVDKFLHLGNREAMLRTLTSPRAVIQEVVNEARSAAIARGATAAEITEATKIAEQAARNALQEAHGFINGHTALSGDYSPLGLLTRHKERIAEIVAEKAVATSLTAGDIALGVITFVPIPGFHELDKHVLGPFMENVIIPAALASSPSTALVKKMAEDHQEAEAVLAKILEENEARDDAAIDTELRNKNLEGIWAAAEGRSTSQASPGISQGM